MAATKTSESKARRTRRVYSCTECRRRRKHCDRRIPGCGECRLRGMEHLCQWGDSRDNDAPPTAAVSSPMPHAAGRDVQPNRRRKQSAGYGSGSQASYSDCDSVSGSSGSSSAYSPPLDVQQHSASLLTSPPLAGQRQSDGTVTPLSVSTELVDICKNVLDVVQKLSGVQSSSDACRVLQEQEQRFQSLLLDVWRCKEATDGLHSLVAIPAGISEMYDCVGASNETSSSAASSPAAAYPANSLEDQLLLLMRGTLGVGDQDGNDDAAKCSLSSANLPENDDMWTRIFVGAEAGLDRPWTAMAGIVPVAENTIESWL